MVPSAPAASRALHLTLPTISTQLPESGGAVLYPPYSRCPPISLSESFGPPPSIYPSPIPTLAGPALGLGLSHCSAAPQQLTEHQRVS